MKKVNFTLTAFRDGLQSTLGARVLSEDYLPCVKLAREVGIMSLESGGGAMFQSQIMYCNENPFDVMDRIREESGMEAELRTLSRGINVVGLESQSSDVIDLHAKLMKKHGTTKIRNFDALNDPDNLMYSAKCIVGAGLKHELAIAMMDLPPEHESVHSSSFYLDILRKFLDAGIPFDGICFKDASGSVRPKKVHECVKGARKLLGSHVPIAFHTHDTAGIGTAAYLSAIEAGVDSIDLSMAPCSGGTCQPDIITLWHALRDTDYTLDIDIYKIMALEEEFKERLGKYWFPLEAQKVEPLIPFFPLPGGALAVNMQMLRDSGIYDRFPEVVRGIGEAVSKGGFGTSVTPISQFYFQQAFNNVLYGPWKKIAEGYGKLVLGYYGNLPGAPDPEVMKLAERQLSLPKAVDHPLPLNDRDPAKGLVRARKMLEDAELEESDENLFITATCLEKGISYLQGKGRIGVRFAAEEPAARHESSQTPAKKTGKNADTVTITVNNRAYAVKFSGSTAIVNGVSYNYSAKDGIDAEAIARTALLPHAADEIGISEARSFESLLSGRVSRVYKKPGDKVAVGETVLVIKAMTMEVPVNSNYSGIITSMGTHQGDDVDVGQTLFRLNIISHALSNTVARAVESSVEPSMGADGTKEIRSPIAGLVLRIYRSAGETIHQGESMLVLEAMKMETPVNATIEGVIEEYLVNQGDLIKQGQAIARVRPEKDRP